MDYFDRTNSDLQKAYEVEKKKYTSFIKAKLNLNMARGKPCKEQLDLSDGMLDILNSKNVVSDYRNYGGLEGIKEARELFAKVAGVSEQEIIIGNNSSLNMMFDYLMRAMQFGVNGKPAWCTMKTVKFLCPSPGYDRHFAICETLGIEMITIPMKEDGPDMDLVETLASSDESIKGIWCVPRFSNPDGVVYSDEVVDRLANMKTASDFVIMWDNAYCVHALYSDAPELKNILTACKEAGNSNRPIMFGSTSKITYPGSGIAFMSASVTNINSALDKMKIQSIGPDKLTQLAHVKFLKDIDGIKAIMQLHAEILRPKFEMVISALTNNFSDTDLVKWNNPTGGYFISLYVKNGCAKKVCELCKKAGMILTPAGATYPLNLDDYDSNIRIAPTFPPLDELEKACDILVCCIKLAIIESITK